MPKINIPAVGPVESKYVWIGGGLVVGIVAFAYYRTQLSPAATEEDAGYNVDESALAEEMQYASGAYATDYAYDGGSASYYPPGFYTPPSTNAPQDRDPVTNNEWARDMLEVLEQVGVDSNAASLAISKYRLKECVTSTEGDIIRRGIGIVGDPPQGSFSILVCPGNPPTNPPPTTPPTTPPPVTKPPPGVSLPAPTGLRKSGAAKTTITMAWNKVPGAAGYRVYRAGVSYNIGASADEHITVGGLRPGTTYTFHVRAVGRDGTYSRNKSSSVKMSTAK